MMSEEPKVELWNGASSLIDEKDPIAIAYWTVDGSGVSHAPEAIEEHPAPCYLAHFAFWLINEKLEVLMACHPEWRDEFEEHLGKMMAVHEKAKN